MRKCYDLHRSYCQTAVGVLHYVLGKDIENRTRKTNIRGTIAIVIMPLSSIDYDAYYWLKAQGYELPPIEALTTGKILGTVGDHRLRSRAYFYLERKGTWGYVLQNPKPFSEPIAAKGNLGFWKYYQNEVA